MLVDLIILESSVLVDPQDGADAEVSQTNSLAPPDPGDAAHQGGSVEPPSYLDNAEEGRPNTLTTATEEGVPGAEGLSADLGNEGNYNESPAAIDNRSEEEPHTSLHNHQTTEQRAGPADIESVPGSSDLLAVSTVPSDPSETASPLGDDSTPSSTDPPDPGFADGLAHPSHRPSEGMELQADHNVVHLTNPQEADTEISSIGLEDGYACGDDDTPYAEPATASEVLPDADLSGHGFDGPNFLLEVSETYLHGPYYAVPLSKPVLGAAPVFTLSGRSFFRFGSLTFTS
jgi:hypothetical protein